MGTLDSKEASTALRTVPRVSCTIRSQRQRVWLSLRSEHTRLLLLNSGRHSGGVGCGCRSLQSSGGSLLSMNRTTLLLAAASIAALTLPMIAACNNFGSIPSPTPEPELISTKVLTPTPTVESPDTNDRPEEMIIEPAATPDPTATSTPEPTTTPDPTPTGTPLPTPSPYPTPTPYPTATAYATATAYPIATAYATATPYPTATAYATATPYPIATAYATATPQPARAGGGTPQPRGTPGGIAGADANVIILADTSKSMRGEKIAQLRAAIMDFVNRIEDPLEYIALIAFNNRVEVELELEPFGETQHTWADRVADLRAGGGTALYDAVAYAVDLLEGIGSQERSNIIVVLTDGVDVDSSLTLGGVISKIEQASVNIILFGLAYGDTRDYDLLALHLLVAAGDDRGWAWAATPDATNAAFQSLTGWFQDFDGSFIAPAAPQLPLWTPAKDFDTLTAAGNNNPRGIWSDGKTMWVSDWEDKKIFAYDMTTKARDPAKDFDTLRAAGNNTLRGIWSDGKTMWVSDWPDGKIFAYDMTTKARDPAKDFDTLRAAGNNDPKGIWSDGTTMWVSDRRDGKIFAYDMTTKARDPAKDFDTLRVAGNNDPHGIWSDGTTMWVSDWYDGKIFAYDMP